MMGSINSVLNNMSALTMDNLLNRNKKAADKDRAKVGSGMKIIGAKDDNSGYAISEKMRAKLRALDQVAANTQNGQSALTVAGGALEQMKEMVTTLKEHAINAANDHNSDRDREAIQVEVDQLVDQIDETSTQAVFNGMSLLDGTFALHTTADNTSEGLVLRGLNTWWISESLDLIKESYGLDIKDGTVQAMSVELKNEGTNGTLAYVSSSYNTATSEATALSLTVNMDYFTNIAGTDTNGGGNPAQYLDRVIAHELTHAVTVSVMGNGAPLWFMEGVAELTHGGDERISGKAVSSLISAAQGNSGNDEMYGGGYLALRYLQNQLGTDTVKHLNNYLVEHRPVTSATLDNAINAVSSGRITDQAALFTEMNTNLAAAGADDAFLAQYCSVNTANNDTGALVGTDATGRHGIPLTAESIIDEGGGSYGRLPTGTTKIDGMEIEWPVLDAGFYGGLVLQTGTTSNQSLVLEIEKVDSGTLGLRNIDLRTQYSAERAIDKLDKSVNKITRLATIVGSYHNRLDFTLDNITAAHENTTAAESVMRDADMAKEMMSYTKNQLLTDTAQAMLAQSAQSAQNVLQLLQ
jgi:flagellin